MPLGRSISPPLPVAGAPPAPPRPSWAPPAAVAPAPIAPAPRPAEWHADSPDGPVTTRSLRAVWQSAGKEPGVGGAERLRTIPTGFGALDTWIGGGLRQGELLLLGGAQGVGKTTLCLQIARNIAASDGATILYACYEHPEEYVFNRLLVQETIDPAAAIPAAGLSLDALQALLTDERGRASGVGLYAPLRGHPTANRAMATVDSYAERFHLLADATRRTSLETIEALVAERRAGDDRPLVLVVDYLQKVTLAHHDLPDETERVTQVVQGLKALALRHSVAVVAIVAAEKTGLTAPRLRFTHLRGSSALMYEADVALILNDKWQIIDRDHIVFNTHKAQQFRDWVICTIEKNRGGRNLVEVEFQKRFEYCCFNPRGGKVAERLYEERIQGERG